MQTQQFSFRFISCAKKDDKSADGGPPHNVILTEQGNAIANKNANEKDGRRGEGETDRMLGAAAEEPAEPDYTDDWKRFFLCLDKLCFVGLVVIVTIVFFYMVYY